MKDATKVWTEHTGLRIDATPEQVEHAVRGAAFSSKTNPDDLFEQYMDLQRQIHKAYEDMSKFDRAYNLQMGGAMPTKAELSKLEKAMEFVDTY